MIATPATPYSTLSLHDALPIFHNNFDHVPGGVIVGSAKRAGHRGHVGIAPGEQVDELVDELDLDQGLVPLEDRKSTRLNSSHSQISYAGLCLKKKTREPAHPPR